MRLLSAILALLIAIAGWFYLFYSRAAQKLSSLEDEALNRKRVLLRRVGGVTMMLLAVCFFMLFWTVDPEESAGPAMAVLLGVFLFLMIIVVLGLIDLRLTWKLRRGGRDVP